MVFSPIQTRMHTPAETYDAQMERRSSDHSYHSADGFRAFAFPPGGPDPIYNIPAMATALPIPIVPASSPVLRPENQQTSYPNSPGSEEYVHLENPADNVIALGSSEEPSDREHTRHKPRTSPPRRRKASTSDSSENSDVPPNANMAGGTGVFPTNKKAKRNQGGRIPGMHLTQEGAKDAREMRPRGSCWR